MTPRTLRGAKTLWRGQRFSVVRTKGSHRREVIVHPGAVVILPLLDAATVVMIRNQRVAAGETLWELPAGTREKGERPAACAARELIEETGYRARRITPLCDFFSSPGICTERMKCYLARGLTHVGQDLDEGEVLRPVAVPLKKAMRMMRTNQIRDGKTIATLLYFQTFGRG